jgi:fructose-1,6-bisphosphatase I
MHRTLKQHLRQHLGHGPRELSDLVTLLDQVAETGIALSREIARAALSGETGLAGKVNVTGDSQKRLDILSNDMVVEGFSETGLVAAIISEEMAEAKPVDSAPDAPYILGIDPLDGSSNTDINSVLGTIFGIYKRRESGQHAVETIPRGADLAAAGYVMYGPGTVLVYSTGEGVHGFTLDNDRGEFLLTHEAIRCPARGHYYSANLGNHKSWHPNLNKYLDYLTDKDTETRRPYSLRYSGALAADMHRSLLEGGLYFYPADAKSPEGKLRYLYECAPLAFVIEHAGGRASTGTERILDVIPGSIHQRVPFVIGSAEDVKLYETFLSKGAPS